VTRLLPIALVLAACGDEQGWRIVDDSVDGHVLSAWSGGNETLLVGGRDGRGAILRTDGSDWRRMDGAGTRTLRWIWGGGAAGPVAVGDGGRILRRESGRWTDQFSSLGGDATLWGVWGSASDDVFAVGGSLSGGAPAVILHWDGGVWIPQTTEEVFTVNFFKVWGCATNRAWIVGEAGTILAWDGAAWKRETAPTDADLYTVHGTADCARVLAVGLARKNGRGVVLSRREAGWQVLRDDVDAPLFGVCAGVDESWVVGSGGYAARVTDDGLKEDRVPTDLDLHACFAAPDGGIWAVGGNLLSGTGSPTGLVAHRGAGVPSGPIDRTEGDGGVVGDAPTGSGSIGPGQECPTGATSSCQPGLRCWYLMEAHKFVCTKDCDTEAFCAAEGFAAGCCARPGSQTTTTVCIPASFGVCP
jgi:hypothetical protein